MGSGGVALRRTRVRRRRRRRLRPDEVLLLAVFAMLLASIVVGIGYMVGRDIPHGNEGMIVAGLFALAVEAGVAQAFWPLVRAILRDWWRSG